MHGRGALRRELSARAVEIAASNGSPHELTTGEIPSVIFGPHAAGHANFHPTSYRNICANPVWAKRLTKLHNSHRKEWPRAAWRWRELDCANSSDALLMNVFCYRRKLTTRPLCSMLGIPLDLVPEFGFKPHTPLRNGSVDRTEIDMRLGDLLIEAKLTEGGFQSAPMRLINRYQDFSDVFESSEVPTTGDLVQSYQLIRGILAAHATGGSFCLLCDARRPDLIESWYSVVRAVCDCALRCRLRLLTWQDLTPNLPKSLRRFLDAKYGIRP